MRGVGWVLLGVVIALVVGGVEAATSGSLLLKVGEGTMFSGKNVTVIGLLGNGVNFRVDGVVGTVQLDSYDEVNGVGINVTGLSHSPPLVILALRVDFVCGDNICSDRESERVCCKDCGCADPEDACLANVCGVNVTVSNVTQPECSRDVDCADGEGCTVDRCVSGSCVHEKVVACVNNDGCCPASCGVASDNDCAAPGADQCVDDVGCDDGDPCTSDRCSGSPRRCVHARASAGCLWEGACVSVGEVRGGLYCSAASVWASLKGKGKACSEGYECAGGKCRGGECRGGVSAVGFTRGVFWVAVVVVGVLVVWYGIVVAARRWFRS